MVSVNADTAASGTLSNSLSSPTQKEALGPRAAALRLVELRFLLAHFFRSSDQFFLCFLLPVLPLPLISDENCVC